MGPTVGGGYRSGCATSVAAPLVTGALALIWGLLPKLKADQVRRLILRNAKFPEHQDTSADATKPRKSRDQPVTGISRLQSNEAWGHEFPATPEGRLDLGFVEEAWERYWSGRDFPGCFHAGAHK